MKNELENQLQSAAAAMNEFANGTAKNAGNIISQSFKIAGNDIAKALELAANNGEVSMKKLISNIMRELSQLAMQKLVLNPLENAFSQAFSGIPNILQNSFANGEIAKSQMSNGSLNSPVNITINMPNGANLTEVRKSANQISASLARIVNRGRGLL